MANTTMQFYRGDTVNRLCTFTKNGAAFSIANTTLWFTAKVNPTDDDEDAAIQKSFPLASDDADAALGKCYFELTPEETSIDVGTYYYDFQLVDASNNVTTLGKGKLKVLQDITVAVA